jgi:hypothetical protein
MRILTNGEITMQTNLSLTELYQFSGSEQFFKHGVNRKLIYTEGIQYLAEKAKCYWLIYDIASVLLPQLLKSHRDQFYALEFLVKSDHSATLTIGDGNGKIYLNHKVKWTDFPIIGESVKFYLCESEEYYCLMLPREY